MVQHMWAAQTGLIEKQRDCRGLVALFQHPACQMADVQATDTLQQRLRDRMHMMFVLKQREENLFNDILPLKFP